MRQTIQATGCVGCLIAISACADKSGRYDVWGTVNFDGKPVPAGLIVFNPDLLKKNDGPQGMAEIVNGRFDTRKLAKGAPSGPVVMMIDGFDGNPLPDQPQGKPLFIGYRVSVELPPEASEQTIEVPISAGAPAKKWVPTPLP